MAWTCEDGGIWSSTINKGETAKGDIVAKLYKIGNKIILDSFEISGEICSLTEGDEYHLVVERIGTMGKLLSTDGFNSRN